MPLPSRDALRRFIAAQPGRVGKREIARAFSLGAADRPALRDLLRDLEAEGALDPAGARRYREPGRLPDVLVLEITGTDPDGDAIARPLSPPTGSGPPPRIFMAPERRGQPALAPGQRVLARLRPAGPGRYEGRTIRRLDSAPGRVVGVYRPAAPPRVPHGRIAPVDRRAKADWTVPPDQANGAEAGEIVLAEPLPHGGLGLKPARIVERLGRMGEARSVSLICIALHAIQVAFPPEALAEAEQAGPPAPGPGPGGNWREDLRAVPLVTIDGEDARDFDDAVFAEPDGDGFRLVVAIADVARYVRPRSALDAAARARGNSVYFPDRVVPMLPEALSNGWCSLRPDEDRACLFAEIRVGPDGRKRGHRFGRGLMRSAARLTYEQVQHAADAGDTPNLPANLPPGQLTTLYAAFRALLAAREARGTLDLDLPERRVLLDESGRVSAILPRPRLDSHRLIEEFMVLANVCAAEELERRHAPCVYRVHAPPSEEKLQGLRDFLAGIGVSLPPGNAVHPRDLDHVLRRVAGTDAAPLVNEVMLRAQSQAAYATDNIGHFGLALPRYAHFTSPIRRYADLLVHRSLIAALGLGADGDPGGPDDPAGLADTAEHVTRTERRAALAERDAIDRYLAAHLADKVGAVFAARVSGVARFGLFVTVASNGASGIVPLATLPDDSWFFDERTRSLSGRRTGATFRLAQPVEVRLAEATPLTGGLVFHIIPDPQAVRHSGRPASRAGQRPHSRRGRSANVMGP